MDYLASHEYHTVTVGEIYKAMTGAGTLPSKPVAITFDDGYLNQYTTAFPLLRSHSFVATFFVITGAVGEPGYLSWEELKSMQQAGMAIESHTVHHRNLTKLDDTQLAAELAGSRQDLRAHLGEDVRILAYPGGAYDQEVIAAAQAAGYVVGLTDQGGDTLTSDSLYAWPRIGIGPGETLTDFAALFGEAK